MKQLLLIISLLISMLYANSTVVHAQTRIPENSFLLAQTAPAFFEGQGKDPSRYTLENIRDKLLPSVATYLGGFIGAIAVVFLIWAGIQFLTAGGDEEKISQATKTAFYILGALILMTFAYAMVYLFLTIFTPSSPATGS